jgi:hypothetical protein
MSKKYIWRRLSQANGTLCLDGAECHDALIFERSPSAREYEIRYQKPVWAGSCIMYAGESLGICEQPGGWTGGNVHMGLVRVGLCFSVQ